MDFSGYFDASEQAFAQEKEDMLYRVDNIGSSWEELMKLDAEAIEKANQLQFLKKTLRTGHLQILRTREEIMQMELKNAQLAFHVRQLQSEVFRLLPFSHSNVPSTEYHMSLDQTLYKHVAKHTREADPDHEKDLETIRAKWKILSELQEEVFKEETRHSQADQDQWNKFLLDFQSQNYECHAGIDQRLAEITRKYVALQDEHEKMLAERKESIAALDKKLKRLKNKVTSTNISMSQKSMEVRQKIGKEASEKCTMVRGRVREIEKRNLQKFSAMKEVDNELQERELTLLKSTDDLIDRVRDWEEKNQGLSRQGNDRLAKLEQQLNAVLSAAAAMKSCTNEQERKIIEAVATAVGRHASTVSNVETVHLQIQRMSQRLERAAENFDI